MMAFDEAVERVLALARVLGTERVALEQADGRVLAEDLVARSPLPAFDYSAMDGYALDTASLVGDGPYELPCTGESAAGTLEPPELAPGGAARIFTGAPLPRGADAVIMQELVTRIDAPSGLRIRFDERPRIGQNLRLRGEDLEVGSSALLRGTRLGPGSVALAAALDRPSLLVARRPLVTVLGSGDELRAPGEPARPGSVVESNGLFVALAAARAGASVRVAPFVRDEPDAATHAIAEALESTDVLVTIGGVSVGDHDVVRPALERAGVGIEFYKVAMKPGKPLTVGRRGGTVVLGLPGNPASASLSFLCFGVPLLRAMQGEARVLPRRTKLVALSSYVRKPGRTELVRATLEEAAGVLGVRPHQNLASGAVTSFARAEALVVVPASSGGFAEGERVEVIAIDDVWR